MGDEYALFPQGDLDIAAVGRLEREWQEVIDCHRPLTLLVDLSDVSFLDCSGVGLLMRAHERQRAHGGRVEIRNPQALPRKVLEITGVDAVLGAAPRPGRGSPACPEKLSRAGLWGLRDWYAVRPTAET